MRIDSLELQSAKRDFNRYRANGRLRNLDVDFNKHIKTLRNGLALDKVQVERVIRLILREMVWMLLVDEGIEVRFGYDYYMYVICLPLQADTISRIEAEGLFVEPNVAQRVFEFTKDDDKN